MTAAHNEHCTDLGNARRLVRWYGEKFRYCERLWGWFAWDGVRWGPDERRWVELCAKDVPAGILDEASRATDSTVRKELATWAIRSESEAHLKAMVRLACSERGVMAVPEEFDSDPYLFNVQNGTLDLRTGQVLPHDKGNLITKVAPVSFDPQATAPIFEKFLADVVAPPVAAYLRRAVGLSMIGKVREHVLLFLFGTGANGKTTLLRTLQTLFGDYAKQADPELLLVRRNDAHPTGVADLFGSRLVVTTEVADGRRLAEALVKQLTGGDRMKARRMHQDFFEFDGTWTIWLSANHKPGIRGTDDGIWRRIRLIPFEVSIPPEDQDEELVDKLQSEFPGILNWALEGCMEYLQNGLQEPVAVLSATNRYRAESDAFGAFLDEETEPGEGIGSSELYRHFKDWCERSGERAMTQRMFGQALSERGYEKGKHPRTRTVIYHGIEIRKQRCERMREDPNAFSHEGGMDGNNREKVSQGLAGSDEEDYGALERACIQREDSS